MYTYNGLQRIQRVLRRILLIVDIGFGNDVILLVTTDEVDVLLTIVVDGGLQAQLLVNGLLERVAEIGNFLDKLDEFLEFQTKEDGGCDGAYGDG